MSMPIPGTHLQAVFTAANEFADSRGHDYVGTEHLLVGMLRTECNAQRILEKLLKEKDELIVRATLTVLEEPGRIHGLKNRHFTPFAQRAFELALRAAVAADSREIDTQHFLLGITQTPRQGEELCNALRVLQLLDIEPNDVSRAVHDAMQSAV